MIFPVFKGTIPQDTLFLKSALQRQLPGEHVVFQHRAAHTVEIELVKGVVQHPHHGVYHIAGAAIAGIGLCLMGELRRPVLPVDVGKHNHPYGRAALDLNHAAHVLLLVIIFKPAYLAIVGDRKAPFKDHLLDFRIIHHLLQKFQILPLNGAEDYAPALNNQNAHAPFIVNQTRYLGYIAYLPVCTDDLLEEEQDRWLGDIPRSPLDKSAELPAIV